MKRTFMLTAILLLLASCVREEPEALQPAQNPEQAKEQVTIRVSMPEETSSKVDITAVDNKLHLAWQSGDKLLVVSGSQSEVFTVSNLISDHVAEFSGTAVSGTSFDILCPGTYASVAEAEADTASPAQDGNGSTSHLRYKALLSGVDSYTDIAFSSDWASAHGGSFQQGAAVKIVAQLPAGVTTLKNVGIGLGGTNYSLPLTNVDVSASGQVLTAYMMLPWADISLPAGTKVPLYVVAADNEAYSRTLSIKGNMQIMQGKQNSFGSSTSPVGGLAIQDFVSGDGSAANPYLIANARQLNNMHNDGVLVSGETKYFKLLEDINASSITSWAPLNSSSPFDKGMDFDGDGHTIDNLTSSGVAYASFAGVLYGNIKDVTFNNATINATSKCGVIAGFLGTTSNDYARVATCTNVIVSNSTVTSTAAAGGFAGHVRGRGSVTGCKVINTTVNGTNILGGFAGVADITGVDKYEVPAIFTSCEVDGVTVNQNKDAAITTLYTGGFIGETYQAHSFINCKVKATTVTATKAAVSNIGGFVGYTGYAGANFINCEVDAASSISAKATNVGGFVGYATVADAYTSCSSAAEVINEASATGGFAGWVCGSAAFKDCTATGDVSGQRFTGGFVGVAENVSFTDCSYVGATVTGNTTNTNAREGGFVGSALSGITFQGCSVSGAVIAASGAGRVGGFVGQLGNASGGGNNITVSQCRVTDTDVNGAINTGGFVGVQYEKTTRCYVEGGTVKAYANQAGGFSAFIQSCDVNHCYTTATVDGGSYTDVGGFVGLLWKSDVQNCFSSGTQNGNGSNRGAFVARCALQGEVGSISDCIGWHATLPFCANNEVGASITNGYVGTSGTVSSQASLQAWPTAIWNLDGNLPVLLAVPSRISAIFVGDSITWQWASNERSVPESDLKIPVNTAYMTKSGSNYLVKFHPGFFGGNGYIDKGISGQNTTQMLARFQKDVVDLNPVVAVIMGGTNDLAQGVAKDDIVANIAAMAEMADAAGIKVVLCSVTPNNDNYSRLSPKNKGGHIITLNGMIQSYASSKGFAYCNYWDSLVADDGLSLKEEYRLYDNLHPGPDGYDVMEPIIKGIIDSLL